MWQALFIDRDGTLGGSSEIEYPGEFEMFPCSVTALKRIKETGIPILSFTNQPGIAARHELKEEFEQELKMFGFDGVYICPHEERERCGCRKPEIGMLKEAAADRGLDLTKCAVIGDRWKDMLAGKKAGCTTVLVRTGAGESEWQKNRMNLEGTVDYVAEDLQEATRWLLNSPQRVLEEILDGANTEARFVLGIDGLSRSGKSTIVSEIEEWLKGKGVTHQIFHIDDHIVERKARYDTGHEEWFEYYSLQWDRKRLREEFFMKLKEGCVDVRLPFYDGELDTVTERQVRLPDKGLIIVEGVFLQREEWREAFDGILFLDCPRERRLLRESEETQLKLEKFRNRYWKAEEYYLDTVRPMKRADWVIPT
ncbi:kinase [Rossellomorea sp. RS05]|uniref:kinase n=1 Tax=Rossellomorea sp. RS05 TaxID=3149166 RepID=UPI003221E444